MRTREDTVVSCTVVTKAEEKEENEE